MKHSSGFPQISSLPSNWSGLTQLFDSTILHPYLAEKVQTKSLKVDTQFGTEKKNTKGQKDFPSTFIFGFQTR